MWFASASVILSNIGDTKTSKHRNKFSLFWHCSSVYQSADPLNTEAITKHGPPHLRRMLVEVAGAITRSEPNRNYIGFL